MLFVGVVGTWSCWSHRATECLAYVVWMVFGDVSISANAHTDIVEVGFVGRHLASKWLEELCHLVRLRAKSSEGLQHLSFKRHRKLAFDVAARCRQIS